MSDLVPNSFSALLQQQQQGMATMRTPDQLLQVYVGNLDPFLGEQEIMQIFSAFGHVVSIDMPKEGHPPKSKGYCFVEYADLAMADKAIAHMQDFVLGGLKLKVGRSTKRKATREVLSPIGGVQGPLPPHLAAGGPNAPAGITKPPGADGTGKRTSVGSELLERRRIVITNIPREFAEKDIRMVLQAFGMVRSCELLPSTSQPHLHCGTCIVEFGVASSAAEAVRTMNGFELGGSALGVQAGSAVPPVSAGVVEPARVMTSHHSVGDLVREAGRAAEALPREPLALPAPAPAPAEAPSRVLLLENLVAAGEVDDDLADEVRGECGNFGAVGEVRVHEGGEPRAVLIFVRFEAEDAAGRARQKMHGRWFGGRQVRASFYSEEDFRSGKFTKGGPG